MNIESIEEGDNIILKATRDIYYKIAKEEDTQIKKLMVDYAKEHNAEIRFIDEEKVKIIIDLGCKEYLKNYQSGYISKDKIKEKLEIERIKALNRFDNKLDVTQRIYKRNVQVALIDKLKKELLKEE